MCKESNMICFDMTHHKFVCYKLHVFPKDIIFSCFTIIILQAKMASTVSGI